MNYWVNHRPNQEEGHEWEKHGDREQAIKDIDNQLKQINITNSALMNADSPTRSLVETRTKFISELTDQRLSIENARIDIETRSIGLMKMVVWIYGKE